jgi:hypothetical protein
MQRITHPSAVAVQPVLIEAGITGYFDDQTPGAETVFTAKWLNRIQEELVNVIEDLGGLTLSGASQTQLRDTLYHTVGRPLDTALPSTNCVCDKSVSVSRTSQIDSGVTYATILASEDSRIYGLTGVPGADSYDATIIGCRDCVIGYSTTGKMCAAIASHDYDVSGTNNACIAAYANGYDPTWDIPTPQVHGSYSAVIASAYSSTTTGKVDQAVLASNKSIVAANHAAVIGCNNGIVSSMGSVLLASLHAELPTDGVGGDYQVGGGYEVLGADIGLANANQNLTWRISSVDGEGYATAWNLGGVDYAEYFPNLDREEIPVGVLVARSGRFVRQAGPGDRILGVVSAHPGVIGGGSDLHWDGKYERDVFGGYIYEMDANGQMSRKLADGYDPSQEEPYHPRSSRPEEWTCVGLLGQLRVRIDETVTEETAYLEPGVDGVGTATDNVTRCEVMDIETPYSAERGYGVALCLVR